MKVAHRGSAAASGITIDRVIDSCGVVGATLRLRGRVTGTNNHLVHADATYVEWNHERGTFGVWSGEELPAAAAAASGMLRGLQRDHTCGAELPIGKAELLAWARAERGSTEPASDSRLLAGWQQRLANLQVRTRCTPDCQLSHVQ